MTIPNVIRLNFMAKKIVAGLLGVAALAVAGCASGKSSTFSSDSPLGSPSPSVSTSEISEGGTGGDTEVTQGGANLTVGQAARVMYRTKLASKETTNLSIATTSVEAGSIGDLSSFKLPATIKESKPFYVTVKFRNEGPKEMEPAGIFGLIKVVNKRGDELSPLSLIGSFKKCDGNPPKSLPSGTSYSDCRVYVAPAGDEFGEVRFKYYDPSLKLTSVSWKVDPNA
ncbi:hypothetical protein [Streptomyces sp. NPDC096153]|uniref:hypothetical protein n=1 Tax=Streptomyces sp. NPDC096153 TaxID=3155548 RepID=UPI00331B7CE4